jgi:iron complex transport system substrate-binding protein
VNTARRWLAPVTLAALAALTAIPTTGGRAVATDRRQFVDAAGRRVEVPAQVARVFAAGGPASIFVYTLAPEKLLGWTRAPSPEDRAFLPPRFAALPALGRLTGRENTASVEGVLGARPDLIVDYGAVTPTYASLADRVQAQTGIPYVLLDGSLSGIPDAYRAGGDLLGVADRGRELAAYAARLLAEVDQRVGRVPDARRPAVYYARGPKGLETGLQGSINVESLDRIGARNVAGAGPKRTGLVPVSVEQVITWNPEVIVTIDPDFAAAVRGDPVWREVRAVQQGRVHLAPLRPFPWVDFPPSVNRLIGLRWLGRVLYPAEFPEDLRQETRAFYTLFYHRPPEERQLDTLLAGVPPLRP